MKMELVIKSKEKRIDAKAIYDSETKETIVQKGSVVSAKISKAKTFKGLKAILEECEDTVDKKFTLLMDVSFKSSSATGNFVTGMSTNGMIYWKTLDGKALRDVLYSEV